MHGAALAEEAAAKHVHHAIGLHQLAPEPLRSVGVVGGVLAIALERDGAFDLGRHGPDLDVHAERAQARHDLGVEVGDRARLQRKRFGPPIAGAQDQAVREEVEVDLHEPALVRHRRRGQP